MTKPMLFRALRGTDLTFGPTSMTATPAVDENATYHGVVSMSRDIGARGLTAFTTNEPLAADHLPGFWLFFRLSARWCCRANHYHRQPTHGRWDIS